MVTNTGIGVGIGIPFRNNAHGGDKPYLPPEIKDSLKAIVIAYGKTNEDSDRSIVKNLVDPDNPFIISNAAYKLNSGYGKYEEDFTTWVGAAISINNGAGFKIERNNTGWWGFSTYGVKATNEFKIKVTNCRDAFSWRYKDAEGIWQTMNITKDGIYTLPASQERDGHDAPRFFNGNPNATYNGLTVEQIPSYQGAFVTDGIDDLITSTKTVQEMGITDEVTVVSMIHQIDLNSTYTIATTNYIENSNSREHVRSDVYNYGKTGIYGYSASLINNTTSDIKNILGDEADYYVKSTNSLQTIFDAKFSVVGRISELTEASQLAWYWTIIANKVLTTDQINQVIAYFNLDRTLKPDILCDVKKQGITNDNHAEFGDKLIDFSGNGRDIQLNNIAWKLDSGIGKYETELSDTRIWTRSKEITSSPFSFSYNGLSGWILFANTELTNSTDIPSFKIQIKGLLEGQELIYRYYDSNGQSNVYSIGKDGEYTLPSDVRTAKPQTSNTSGFQVVKNEANIITITQIPSHAGALCLDGVNDFGKVTGMPIYKDYTIVVDYERISGIEQAWAEALISKAYIANQGAFVLMETNGMAKHLYSFGAYTTFNKDDSTRTLLYQSKYKCGDVDLNAGTGIDRDTLWLGTYRDNYSSFFNGAIYSLMSFPYSMSEFLIERQLKKHKLGTLYPDMVEFRPVIKSNVLLDAKPTFVIRGTSTYLNAGDYVPENSQIWVSIKMNNIADRITKFTVNGKTINIPENAYSEVTLQYGFPFVIDKSPQKITMTIEQDENYVQWNPVVESNVAYKSIRYYKLGDSGSGWIGINIGDYIPIGRMIMITIDTANTVDELVSAVSSQLTGIGINGSNGTYNITGTLTSESPQNINITIDEYIRFEDIVQPYPLFFEFTDENGNLISWGGKAKVGNTIIRTKSVSNANILAGLYNSSSYKLNGKPLEGNSYVVEKQMVFTCTTTYLLDNNEPKCILSPSRLRIPNSSYKLLGYIPDISGHGNHGVIHNSAYAEGSGVNEDGSYQFDGVDDFVTIPTIVGGKQVLMKVNWNTINSIIYDQRGSGGFAIYCSDYNNPSDSITVPAYRGRNAAGTTYIDGIRNEYIIASQLRNVTHNIVEILDTSYAAGKINPIIGKSYMNSNYGSLALYDFMLFDEISTDDKILELNEYVGIEGNTE